MKEREVTDQEGTSWSCVQAFSAGNEANSEKIAELTEGDGNHIPVVCTPSGGAQSIRLQLPQNWLEDFSDEALLKALQTASKSKSTP